MKANIHNIDKAVRIVLVIVVAVLYFTGFISGTVAIIYSFSYSSFSCRYGIY